MAKSGKKKQDQQVEEVAVEHVEGEKPTTKRPKKVAAQGKRHRSGSRHRDSRRRGFHHLLNEENEEDDELS